MLYRDICKILSYFFFGLAAAMILPLFVAAYYEFAAPPEAHPQAHGTVVFLETIGISALLGLFCRRIGQNVSGYLFRREGIIVVVLIWFLSPAVAGIPYLLSGTLQNPFQAYFEAASGFTTTGATTFFPKRFNSEGKEIPYQRTIKGVHDTTYTFYGTIEPIRDSVTGIITHEGVEAVGKAILFWRSFTQWLGGMGIIVLFVAVLPALGVGGRQLFHAEMPGPIKDSLTPRIKETASNLWKIYLGITLLQVVLLMLTDEEISLFDAVTITFSTVSTGGFSVKNASIGAYKSASTEWVIIIFMFLSSVNFSLYFFMMRGKLYRLYDTELILYIFMLAASCLLCTYFLVGTEKILLVDGEAGVFSLEEALRYGSFQVISAQTTTGFSTANYNIWPYTTQVIMILVMYFGGMAGSTAGGMKVMRHFMIFRIVQYKVESLFRPETVRTFRIANSEVDTGAVVRTLSYFVIVVAIATLGAFLMMMDGFDPESAFATVTLMINNIGIGFRITGPTESCAFMTNESLSLSSLLMIMGRLEFFAVLAILVPAFWKQRS